MNSRGPREIRRGGLRLLVSQARRCKIEGGCVGCAGGSLGAEESISFVGWLMRKSYGVLHEEVSAIAAEAWITEA